MNAQEMRTRIQTLETDAKREYKEYACLSKPYLLQEAKRRQRVNDFTMQTSKNDLIDVILESSHYYGIRNMERALRKVEAA